MTRALLQTDKGDINIELFSKEAPGTVANFVKLIEAGFYDGLAFHRVIENFMIQGGCPNSREGASGSAGTGGPGWKIPCETAGNPH
ncbi:MAG: peptidylprolyl isomerase, partial [Holophagaceae bacterium]|nr:peptidylprolyl isomerase [Holophagaceae bacterium]